MNFYSARDLQMDSKAMWDCLSAGDEIVITNNEEPKALMIGVSQDNFEEVVQAVRQAKAMIAFNSMRRQAADKGFISEEEIEVEIQAVRCKG